MLRVGSSENFLIRNQEGAFVCLHEY